MAKGQRVEITLDSRELNRLLNALKDLPTNVEKKAIRKGMRAGLKVLKDEVKHNAPEGETGDLKKGVKIKAGKRKKGSISMSVAIGDGGEQHKGDLYYAAMVEYGTSKQPAQHFMLHAFEAKKDQATDAVVKAVEDYVRTIKENDA